MIGHRAKAHMTRSRVVCILVFLETLEPQNITVLAIVVSMHATAAVIYK